MTEQAFSEKFSQSGGGGGGSSKAGGGASSGGSGGQETEQNTMLETLLDAPPTVTDPQALANSLKQASLSATGGSNAGGAAAESSSDAMQQLTEAVHGAGDQLQTSLASALQAVAGTGNGNPSGARNSGAKPGSAAEAQALPQMLAIENRFMVRPFPSSTDQYRSGLLARHCVRRQPDP